MRKGGVVLVSLFFIALGPAVVSGLEKYTSREGEFRGFKCPGDNLVELKAEDVKRMKGAIKSTNGRCVHEAAQIDEKGGISIVPYASTRYVDGAASCKNQNCECATVSFANAEGLCARVSKCDSDAVIAEKLKPCFGGGAAEKAEPTLDEYNRAALESIEDPDSDPGRAQLKRILKGLGVENAEDAVNADPAKVQEYLLALADGDQDKAKELGDKLGITLNEDLKDAKKLQASLHDAISEAIPEEQVAKSLARDSTFPSPEERDEPEAPPGKEIVIDPKGEPGAAVQNWRGKQGLATRISPERDGQFSADAVRRVCATVSRCHVSMDAMYATGMKEMGDANVRGYGDGYRSASLGQVYAGQAGFANYLARYKQVYGEDYLLHATDIRDASINPEWIASQSRRMQAIVLQDKGERTGGSFQQLLSAYNGSGPAAAAYGVGALRNAYALQSGSAPGYWQTAYNVGKAALADGPAVTNLAAVNLPAGGPPANPSPFGNVYPFSSASPSGRAASGASPAPAPAQPAPQRPAAPVQQAQQLQQPVSSQLLNQQGPIGTPGVLPGSALVSPVQPVASLIVQPKEVVRGNPLVVSWSSVGISASNPCQVFVKSGGTNTLLARGNEGTRTLPTSATSTPGTWNFTARCETPSGTLLEKEASALVK